MSKYKWKGRFVSKDMYKALCSRSENARNRLKKIVAKREEAARLNEVAQLRTEKLKGNRIVDLDYFAEQMFCDKCSCELFVRDIEDEQVTGLGSYLFVRCRNCLSLQTVKSSRQYINPASGQPVFSINTKAALGAIHSGMGQTHLSELFNVMELPTLNSQTFKKHERIIGPVIEFVAKDTCSEATAMERVMTEQSINEIKKLLPPDLQEGYLIINADGVDPEGKTIVRIFASYDMGWSQRGNGYSYDSLNGYCALIGLKTGKVLDYCTRNRKCRICDTEMKTGLHKDHDCRLNFEGPAKAMEADGAVQLVTKSQILKEANVQVGVFIGDNDSSSIAAIQNASDYKIIKQSDMNHTTKNIGSALHDMHKVNDPEKELTNDIIKHIQRCFTFAVHQNKGDLLKIQEAIKNIPEHLFDHHDNCGPWCRDESENVNGIRLYNTDLYDALKKFFHELADNGYKFVSAASSQANESLNHSMCSKAPKGNSYSTSESCDYRFAATVAQKNIGKNYLVRTMDTLDMIVNKQKLEKFAENYDKKRLAIRDKSSQPEFKKQRLENKITRAQLKNKKDHSENHNYKSGMTLLDKKQPLWIHVLDIKTPYNFEDPSLAIIFFDLETSSLKPNCDILQISMKCHKYILNIYLSPTQSIQPQVTKVNGFSKVHKKLFQHGKEVPTLTKQQASNKIIEYLSIFKKKCVLVAHNCNFDSKRLLTMIQKLSLVELYEEYVYGFCDTLSMFKKKFPQKKTGHKLTTLASEQNLSCEGAHDAEFDVLLLENLCVKNFSTNNLIENTKTIYDVLTEMENTQNTKKLLPSFAPLKGILSVTMQKKLASYGISCDKIIETFKTKGDEETTDLLKNKVNGKSTIMKSEKPIKKVLDHLKLHYSHENNS